MMSRMTRTLCAALAVAVAAATGTTAGATTYKLTGTGSIDSVANTLEPFAPFEPGDAASFTVIFDAPTFDVLPSDPDDGFFFNAISDFDVSLGSYPASANAGGLVRVSDADATANDDVSFSTFPTDSSSVTGAPLGGFSLVQFSVRFDGAFGVDVFAGDDIPLSLLNDAANWDDIPLFALFEDSSGNRKSAKADIDSVSLRQVVAVPGPVGLPLFGSALLLLGLAARRRPGSSGLATPSSLSRRREP